MSVNTLKKRGIVTKQRLSEKMEQNAAIEKIRRFLCSKTFMVIQCLIGAAFVIARGMGDIMPLVYGNLVLGAILCFVLVICDDLIASLLPFLLICCISIKCYNSFDIYIKLIPLAPVILAVLIFHFVVYRQKLDMGKTWPGAAAVAIAVTLGGLGKISAREYFSGTALFYTFGLGIGMFLMYMLMNTHYHASDKYVLRLKFSFIMMLMGLFCVFMIVHHYILFWPNFISKLSPIYFQWRNNASTILMLSMPFAFYLSIHKYPFLFIGGLEYIAILFTGSRGGALGGTIECALCLIVLVYCDKKNRKKTLITIASIVTIALSIFIVPLMEFFGPVLTRLAGGDSIREGLIRRAVEDFKSNVLFGRGLGYNGNNDVHNPAKFAICWYHSSPFQVIGSFGLVGVAAFGFQLYNRMKVIWSSVTVFNLTLFVSYAGLFMMSLVNPGEFCPIPYGMIATLLFIICDKNNIAPAYLPGGKEEEIKIELT